MSGKRFAFQTIRWERQNRKYHPYSRNENVKVCSCWFPWYKRCQKNKSFNLEVYGELPFGDRQVGHSALTLSCELLLLNQFLTCKDIFPNWVVSCVCHFPPHTHRMPTTSLPEVIKLPFDHAENIFFSCLIHCSSSLAFGSLTTPSLSPHSAHSDRKLLSILCTFVHYAFSVPLTATCLRVCGPWSSRSCDWVLEMGSVWLERWRGKMAGQAMGRWQFFLC